MKGNPYLNPYEQAVTSFPEVFKYELGKGTEFILMGCDGIWDCVNIEKLCDFISSQLKKGTGLSEIVSKVMDNLISKTRNCIYII